MPESRARRKAPPQRKRRDKTGQARARKTQASQDQAETKKMTPGAYRRRRAVGWTLVSVGAVVAVQHWLHHLGLFTVISPGADDLFVGYPMGGLLFVAGTIVLSKS